MFDPGTIRATSTVLAVLLLAATVAPPAVSHSHPLDNGDESLHRHMEDHGWPHAHRHHHHESGHRLARPLSSEAEITHGDWRHLHFRFLGLDLTLPEPTSNESDSETRERNALSVLASDEAPLPCQTTVSSSVQQMFRTWMHSSSDDAAPMQVVVSAPAPVSCTPLCDRARRERSGVLLA
jgi:hypothetical protein